MSSITYFQRFSQRENHVTNNTLLVLRHLYRVSPTKISLLLNALFEEEVPIGLEFQQQIHGTHSVPDALITQQPLHIFIEAKQGDALDADQLDRHIASIADQALPDGSAILIGLTRQRPPDNAIDQSRGNAQARGIRLFCLTYRELALEVEKLCAEYEQDLNEIVQDYKSFLTAEGLLTDPHRRLVVFPCGTSWRENIRFGLYYEPPSRPVKLDCRFLGIYHNKQISHIGQIDAVAVYLPDKDSFRTESVERGTLTEDQKSRIRDTIAATSYYDLNGDDHRFYIVSQFVPTAFEKASHGGMRGHRYFDLTEYVNSGSLTSDTTADVLAAALRAKQFS